MLKIKVAVMPGMKNAYSNWVNENLPSHSPTLENGESDMILFVFNSEANVENKSGLLDLLLASINDSGITGNLILPRSEMPGPSIFYKH